MSNVASEKGKFSGKQAIAEARALSGVNAYQWANSYRMMVDGCTYSLFNAVRYMEYLYEPYMVASKLKIPGGKITVMKCVQTGWSEWAINIALWFMDVKREPVLYMLQTDKQLGPFVLARFDPAIEMSPYIREGFAGAADSVGLKVGWKQPLYFRGAKSPGSLVEFSVGMVVQDEKDQMDPDGIVASLGRLEGRTHKWKLRLSNPSIPEHGIDIDYNDGSRGQYAHWCETCQKYQIPVWPDSANANHPLEVMCPEGDHPLDVMEGIWIHEEYDNPHKSYSMSHFSSPTVQTIEMIEEYSLIRGDPTKMAGFHNLKLGHSWAEQGTQITDVSGLPSMGQMVPSYDRQSVMGVDVGGMLHVIVLRTFGGILWAGELTDWADLGRMMHAYNVINCVIDIEPETTKATEFAKDFPGRVVLCDYHSNPLAKEAIWGEKDGAPVYTGLRTAMIDAALALIHTKSEGVPSNLPSDFWAHFRAVTRLHVKRADGKVYSSYVHTKPDHYVHAFNYAVFAGEKFQGTGEEQTQFFSPHGRGGGSKRNQDPSKQGVSDAILLEMAMNQGYVGKNCTLKGGEAMNVVYAGGDPCAGCSEERGICHGRPRRG